MTSSNGSFFARYWPFERRIHRSPVNSPHKGQWRGTLKFSLICAWINGWVNNGEADLRRHRAHYDVIVMEFGHHWSSTSRYRATVWYNADYTFTNVKQWLSIWGIQHRYQWCNYIIRSMFSQDANPRVNDTHIILRYNDIVLLLWNWRCSALRIPELTFTMTSKWVRWHLRLPASRLFVEPFFFQAQIKENIIAPRH